MTGRRIGFWLGWILALAHLGLVLICYRSASRSGSSTAGLVYIVFFFLDAPLMWLPRAWQQALGPLGLFGLLGSLLWLAMPWFLGWLTDRALPRVTWWFKAFLIVLALGLVGVGFQPLAHEGVAWQIRQERPRELKPLLNRATTAFLQERMIVFGDDCRSFINSLCSTSLTDPVRFWVGMSDRVSILDDRFEQRWRLDLFPRVSRSEPFQWAADHPETILTWAINRGIALVDVNGAELWAVTGPGQVSSLKPDGALAADVDGDGIGEVVVAYRYRDGIRLLDAAGRTRWTRPVYGLDHLEVMDLDGDGSSEIVYKRLSGLGRRGWLVLDGAGQVRHEVPYDANGIEFALIRWPDEHGTPTLLVSEENQLRLLGLDGSVRAALPAPGCRPFGRMDAAVVHFEPEVPFLTVRKRVHPDLLVLYVYDREGRLVYLRTEASTFGRCCDLIVLPDDDTGAERLVCAGVREDRPVLLEYRRSGKP